MADTDTDVRTVQDAVESRLREDSWNREKLINSVAAEFGIGTVVVEEAIDSLLRRGIAYEVPTTDGKEVKLT